MALLYALLGALAFLSLLFLLVGGDSLIGMDSKELHKRTPIFFSMMFICFGAAGWVPLQNVMDVVLPHPPTTFPRPPASEGQ